MMAIASLLFFSLWFWLDPEPAKVLNNFLMRGNAGKFNTGGESYLLNFFWGQSSIWRIAVSYPLNAGLLALAVVAVFWDAWKRRRHLGHLEVFLWIWMLVLAAFFCIPNQRDERYLIPAMPALALLLALRLGHLPRWVITVTLAAAGIVIAGLTGLAFLLQQAAGIGFLYPLWVLLAPLAGLLIVGTGIFQSRLARPLLPSALLMVYLAYAAFLIPLDHGPGLFKGEGVEAVIGSEVAVPSNFNAREESYGFLLPGAIVKPYDHWRKAPSDTEFAVISLPLGQTAPHEIILARRLNMIDRFNAAETRDILSGNITRNLFRWDWLVQQK